MKIAQLKYTTQANIHYAKTHLSKLLEAVARGEAIVIAKSSKPMKKLVPIQVNGFTEKNRHGNC